ncbi:MAG: peptidase E [Gammaproteobacteria bacterium]|nr:peptidase E [Gammaproteobacteria bacterium]
MGSIVAIGGGAIRTLATEPLDHEIVRLAGKSRPHALLIPTASSDDPDYTPVFERVYGRRLGCTTDVLHLLGRRPDRQAVRDKIGRADIIYVGGGNTLMMMRRWRHLGVDALLRAAFDRGVVMCGVSAGAICWFERGHSDSMAFYNANDWRYIAVTGLGFAKGIACPHYNSHTNGVPRREDFHQMLKRVRQPGLAIDNNCAVAFTDDGFRVLSTRRRANAYALSVERGEITQRKLPKSTHYMPVESLHMRRHR